MRRYLKSDLEVVNAWHVAHRKPELTAEVLPGFGLLVPGVAAGFAYITDSSVALLENYITNPAADSLARHSALVDITSGLIAHCREAGMGMVLALTQDESVAQRARETGLRDLGSYMMLVGEV